MAQHPLQRIVTVAFIAVMAGCSFGRQDDADLARHMMVGTTKEEVLTCMGPPEKRAAVGITEVWSYESSGGQSTIYKAQTGATASRFTASTRNKTFCTVNIVMKSDYVTAVKYLGPRGDLITPDEQCAYAIEKCVRPD